MAMERATRVDLTKTIESQKEQLQRYEKRLRDMVQAYKGLLKEKEALDASVKVLSKSSKEERSPRQPSRTPTTDDGGDSSAAESDTEGRQFDDPLQTNSADAEDTEERDDQLQTLTASLLTLTQEKSKLEASYVSDKKRLIQENEELSKKLEEQQNKHEAELKTLEQTSNELKNRIRSQQAEREKEQNAHASMLRELQRLLAEERNSKEQLENQLEDTTAALREKEKLLPNMSEHFETRTQEMTREIKSLRSKLQAMEDKAKEPSPLVLNLQTEVAELKAQYRVQVQQEQHRVLEAENKLKQLSEQSEKRVSTLEAKISELSEVVGDYERLRFQDQQTTQKLKDRLIQLDMENTVLARAAHSPGKAELGDEDQDPANQDPHVLADKLVTLKGLLKLANQKAANPVDIDDLLQDDTSLESNKYKEELEKVKEEFERYKLRAQSVLKNKSTKDVGNTKEVDLLKSQIKDLKDKLKTLHLQMDEDMEMSKHRTGSMQKTVVSLQEKHKQDAATLAAEYKQRIGEMDIELRKQRERTVSLLAEKDREIGQLKAGNVHRIEGTYYSQLRNPPDSGASAELPMDVLQSKSEEERAVSRLLNLGHGDANLIYFSQEQARKDVEINSLRKQKHEIELALRDLQISASTQAESLSDTIDNMKESVRKSERDKIREGANLEYLKNVTYKFLISVDPQAKQQMMNAITTILQFSPQEKAVVHTQFKGWWKH
ncbi:GRIP and coiled-coil domain-containing protein 1-like [Mizuhopecten yessoensis]|uniref:GRIP and coiled-coil domain-containing protein 1 n=1 Tax=Mizuhopecten yessoensis TaxID=6573 RepID=A0A210QUE7_MIZYE|nr:GRIP and coiled-coil domain-containing protein 1-like [Mizuhopecten yessoensis]XP_021349583.1 GRIP and coiled-coil domain-containing protein 1-like [Mizuhopecten yessoensis]OWF52312.1 GRIP and coiled-coil domain-containing protein 1 [Mizuhopecten yessoensis]